MNNTDTKIIKVHGKNIDNFFQNIITNDINNLNENNPLYRSREANISDAVISSSKIDFHDKRFDWYTNESEPPSNNGEPCFGNKYTVIPQEDIWNDNKLCINYEKSYRRIFVK